MMIVVGYRRVDFWIYPGRFDPGGFWAESFTLVKEHRL